MRSLSRRSPIVGRGYELAVQACGPLACNMYALVCGTTGHAAVIDPSFQNPFELESLRKYFEKINNNNSNNNASVTNIPKVELKHILLTHGHADHVCGIVEMLKEWPQVQIHMHPLEEENYTLAPEMALHFGLHIPLQPGRSTLPDPTHELYDGQRIQIGTTIQLDVIHTPGHAPGHVAFVDSSTIQNSNKSAGDDDDNNSSNDVDDDDDDDDNNIGEDDKTDGAVIISGDLIFQGSVGRTDFHNSSMEDLNVSIRRLYELYGSPSTLSSTSSTILLSGHTTPTSLERERTSNPFVDLALRRPIGWYNDAVERHGWKHK